MFWTTALLCTLKDCVGALPRAQRKPRSKTHWDYDINQRAFDQNLLRETDYIKQRRGYTKCPLKAREIDTFFRWFVVAPGGPFNGTGALWRKTLSIELGANVDGGLRETIADQLADWKKKTKSWKGRYAITKSERTVFKLGVKFMNWLDLVQAQAKRIDGLHTSHIHIQIYGWNKKTFVGRCHADMRLKADEPDDVGRVLLPAADCYGRPLLFIAANGSPNDNGTWFNFSWNYVRVVGVAFGAIFMNARGCGAMPLLPPRTLDLSAAANHEKALEVRMLHGAFVVGKSRRRGTKEVAVTVVLSGHTKRGDE